MKNNNALNLNVLSATHPCQFEEWREKQANNDRQIRTSAVAQPPHVPVEPGISTRPRAANLAGFLSVQLR